MLVKVFVKALGKITLTDDLEKYFYFLGILGDMILHNGVKVSTSITHLYLL